MSAILDRMHERIDRFVTEMEAIKDVSNPATSGPS
jgi:hypothetical protein